MKENLRRLHLIFRLTRLRPEMFYSITCDEYEIAMQGYERNIIVSEFESFKFVQSPYVNTWLLRNNIRIVRS